MDLEMMGLLMYSVLFAEPDSLHCRLGHLCDLTIHLYAMKKNRMYLCSKIVTIHWDNS